MLDLLSSQVCLAAQEPLELNIEEKLQEGKCGACPLSLKCPWWSRIPRRTSPRSQVQRQLGASFSWRCSLCDKKSEYLAKFQSGNLTCKQQNFQQYLFWRSPRNISVAWAGRSVCERGPALSSSEGLFGLWIISGGFTPRAICHLFEFWPVSRLTVNGFQVSSRDVQYANHYLGVADWYVSVAIICHSADKIRAVRHRAARWRRPHGASQKNSLVLVFRGTENLSRAPSAVRPKFRARKHGAVHWHGPAGRPEKSGIDHYSGSPRTRPALRVLSERNFRW